MGLDRIWSDRPVVAAARLGVPAGAVFGLLQLPTSRSVGQALADGVLVGVFFGGFMVWLLRKRWRQSAALAPDDRVIVARTVRRGDAIGDARLAGAVIEYAGVIRRNQERDARLNWVLVVVAVATLISAVRSTVTGATGTAVLFWVYTAFWAVGFVWLFPWRRARILANADRAERAAQRAAKSEL